MESVGDVSEFLSWYYHENDDQRQLIDDQLPDWLEDRTPRLSEENVLVPFNEYDLDSRLSEESPEVDGRWLRPADHTTKIERVWRDSTEQEGLEAFAWYVPFHYSTRRWGIYVSEEGIQILGNLFYEWARDLGSGRGDSNLSSFDSKQDAFQLALEVLLRHEWYHHQVELLASYIEDIQRDLCYQRYHEDVYREDFASSDCIEESLANAYVSRSEAVRQRSPSSDVFDILFEKSTDRQPEAYAEFEELTGGNFSSANRALGYLIKSGERFGRVRTLQDSDIQLPVASNLPFSTGVHRPRNHRQIPIYIVRPNYNIQTISYFKSVQLETDYDLVRSDMWEEKYTNSPDLQSLVNRTEEKLRHNINLSGFNWRRCSGTYEYGRMNDQYRMIVEKDESSETIYLIDFGGHDLPKDNKYGCY